MLYFLFHLVYFNSHGLEKNDKQGVDKTKEISNR